ncbi:3486_t:CDS:2, partial [Dentiscutata erythropus]
NLQNSQIENNNVNARQLHEQEDKAIKILRQLQEQNNDWDMQRVRIYWNNNRYNKKKKVSPDM